MNKRKRMAALKHRLRHIRYEAQRRLLLATGTAAVRLVRRRDRFQPIEAPLPEAVAAVAAPVRRSRRAAAPVAAETAAEPAAPVRRTRRAVAPAIAETAAEPAAPVRRPRRAPRRSDQSDISPGEQEAPAQSG